MAVLTPDGAVLVLAIVWGVEGVVDAAGHDEEPGEDREDLVCPDGLSIVGVSLGEWVDCEIKRLAMILMILMILIWH